MTDLIALNPRGHVRGVSQPRPYARRRSAGVTAVLPGPASGGLATARYACAMRIAASFFLLAIATPAFADDGAGLSLDFGYAHNRVAVTDQTTLGAETARFGIRVSLGRHFHFGGEAEEGSIQGTTSLPSGAIARTSSSSETASPLDGNTLGIKAYAGLHANVGRVMFGADLATGLRDTWVDSDAGRGIAGRANELLLETRARADLSLTDAIAFGVVASTDLIERRDVSLAGVLSLNFTH